MFKEGETIYREGLKPDFFYGIIKGKVSVRKSEKIKNTTKHVVEHSNDSNSKLQSINIRFNLDAEDDASNVTQEKIKIESKLSDIISKKSSSKVTIVI